MGIFIKIFYVHIIFLVGLLAGYCQTKVPSETFYFHRLTTADNLTSQKFNYYLKKDQKGFVWISSPEGLNRYDGIQIKQYPSPEGDTLDLSDPNISSSFYEIDNENLVFSTTSGIQLYNQKNDHFIPYKLGNGNKLYTHDYYLLHVDSLNRNLWARVGNTLMIHSLNSPPNQHIFKKSYPLNVYSKIFKNYSKDEYFLFIPGKDRGLKVFTFSNQKEVDSTENLLPTEKVLEIHYKEENKYWIGTTKGLAKLDLTSGLHKMIPSPKGYNISYVNGIIFLDERNIIISTQRKGLFLFDPIEEKFISQVFEYTEKGISKFNYPIDKIYLDPNETLWISTDGKGVYFTNLKNRRFTSSYQSRVEKPRKFNSVQSLFEDSKGQIWCLVRNGVVVLDSLGNEVSNYTGKDVPFNSDIPFYIFLDNSGNVWIASQRGLYRFNEEEGNFEKIKESNRPSEEAISFYHIAQMEDSTLLASSMLGIHRIELNGGMYSRELLPLFKHSKSSYSWVCEIPEKKLLLTARVEQSLDIFSRENQIWKLRQRIPFTPFINSLIKDLHRDIIWIVTPEGLYDIKLSTDSLTIQTDTILPYRILNAALLDQETHTLWISTNRGLVSYNPDSATWQVYGVADGLQADEFNFWSAYKTQNGKMIFGGVNGINIFRPSEIKPLGIEAHPVITSLLINDQTPREKIICEQTGASNLSLLQKIRLPYEQNTLSFRFAPLEYSDPSANLFRYRMVPEEQDWIESGNENFTRYPNLSPGLHTFELQATNSDQIWSQKITRLHIVITPPWYETWWFRTLAILAGLFIIYSSYRIRVGQIQRQAEVKNRMALFQQKEAEYKQLVAETETAVLRLQMNPHFIFNSMNSIHSYILEKDMDTASTYLNRFAALMRMILQNGARGFISIAQEIELLKLYMDTEAMRFENKFDYKFSISNEIDPDEVAIPTMILQPFVENSILHGIRSKEVKGLIGINFWEEHNRLHCTVTDNGIGREAAKGALKLDDSHESQAVAITQRRLNLLESEEGAPPSILIKDLFNEEGLAVGTQVYLVIPLL